MKPFIVLLSAFALSLLVLRFIKGTFDYAFAGRIAMSAMLVFTAIGHFAFTKGMARMIPDFIPAKTELVLLTGVFEMLLALGLLLPKFKYTVGWVIILFFILILPANIKASLESINYQTGELNGNGLSYLWFRIPLQVFFMAWVYFVTIKH